jgi:hypothetical protein
MHEWIINTCMQQWQSRLLVWASNQVEPVGSNSSRTAGPDPTHKKNIVSLSFNPNFVNLFISARAKNTILFGLHNIYQR